MIDIQLTPTGRPPRYLDSAALASGWRGLECVLADLLDRWCPRRNLALEFGVEHGFSTVALSNYFTRVIGVDHFLGDEHAGLTPPDVDRYRDTRLRLAPFPNIELFRMSAQDFMARCDSGTRFDLVHVDAKHDGQTTYDLTTWGARRRSPPWFAPRSSAPRTTSCGR